MKNRIKSYETIIKNQHGNIVGVIGVIGLLLGALAINVSDSVQLDQKIQKYIGQKSAEDLFREEIETVFNTREGCSLTLSGMNSDGSDTIQIIRGPFGEPIIDLTSTTKDGKVIGSVGNAPLSILGIDLINQVETTPATNTVDPITGNQEANFERVIRASIRIRYAKGQWYDTDGNLIPQNALEQTAKSGLEAKKSIGNSNLALQIPLTIRHNSDATGSNGSIISCASLDHDNQQVRNRDLTAMETSISQYCSNLFRGNAEVDGFCRRIQISDNEDNPANNYAVTFQGNVLVNHSTINPATGTDGYDNLYVEGNLGINRDPTDAAGNQGTVNDGFLNVNHSLLISDNTAHNPPSRAGSAHFNSSLGVGIVPPAATGQLHVNHSTAIGSGVTPSNTEGDLTIENAVGVNTAPPNFAGGMHISNSLGVGIAPDGVSGNTSSLEFSVGNAATRDAIPSADGSNNMIIQGYLDIPDLVNSGKKVTSSSGITLQDTHVASQRWAANRVARTFDPGIDEVTEIMNYVLASETSTGFNRMCPSYLLRTATNSYVYGQSPGECDFLPTYCDQNSPRCPTVYAGSSGVQSTGSITTSASVIANSGNIVASNTMSAPNINATSRICLNGNCKTNWSKLTFTNNLSCSYYNVDVDGTLTGTQCPTGEYIRRINRTTKNITYSTNFSVSGYTPVLPKSTVAVLKRLSYQCCSLKVSNY